MKPPLTDPLRWPRHNRVLKTPSPAVLHFEDERVELHLRLLEADGGTPLLGRYDLDLVALAAEGFATVVTDTDTRSYSIQIGQADGAWFVGPGVDRVRLSDFASDPEIHDLDERQFEAAVVEVLRTQFEGPGLRVEPSGDATHYIRGRLSGVPRQIDAAVYRADDDGPFLVADAKWLGRNIDVKGVEAFIGMVEDVGAEVGMLVGHRGFSPGARRRAHAAELELRLLRPSQALRFHWRTLARSIYPWDWVFHDDLAAALRALEEGGSHAVIERALEGVAFEEWEAYVAHAIRHHPGEAVSFLRWVAEVHVESGWRFNAIRHLHEIAALPAEDVRHLLASETDFDTRDLLSSLLPDP